jgi:hypothetical protein
MKCSNPDCNRGIGLVTYRRGWFSKRRYCSRNCRDAVVAIDRAERSHSEQTPATYFDWLFELPVLRAQPKLVPAAIRARSEPGQRFRLKARNDWRCEGWRLRPNRCRRRPRHRGKS